MVLFPAMPAPLACVVTPNNAGFSVTRRLRAVPEKLKLLMASYGFQMDRMSSASLQSLRILSQLDDIRSR
jgi:hypothetical protein